MNKAISEFYIQLFIKCFNSSLCRLLVFIIHIACSYIHWVPNSTLKYFCLSKTKTNKKKQIETHTLSFHHQHHQQHNSTNSISLCCMYSTSTCYLHLVFGAMMAFSSSEVISSLKRNTPFAVILLPLLFYLKCNLSF